MISGRNCVDVEPGRKLCRRDRQRSLGKWFGALWYQCDMQEAVANPPLNTGVIVL